MRGDVFVDELDLAELGFGGVDPEATGRPSYHPAVLLKLYIYGYLNRVQSSRRLEREAGRNVEVMWLTGRLAPDHKTIADFRKDNCRAIRQVCAQFVALCRTMGLLAQASVAIDGSKFKAVNNRDRNFTRAKMDRRMAQIEESVARYLQQLDSADRQEPSEALQTKTSRLKEKIEKLKEQMQRLEILKVKMLTTPDQQISLTDPDSRSMATSGRGSGVVGYNVQVAVETKHHLIITHRRQDGRDLPQGSEDREPCPCTQPARPYDDCRSHAERASPLWHVDAGRANRGRREDWSLYRRLFPGCHRCPASSRTRLSHLPRHSVAGQELRQCARRCGLPTRHSDQGALRRLDPFDPQEWP